MLSADWLQFSLVSDWLGSTPEVVLRVTDLYPIHDEALDCPDGLAATLAYAVWLAAAYGHGDLVCINVHHPWHRPVHGCKRWQDTVLCGVRRGSH